MNPDPKRIARSLPHTLLFFDERVTEEMLRSVCHPQNPLLNSPNRITQADFATDQERGLYFRKSGSSLHALSQLTTPESRRCVGHVFGRHGKGKYIYTSRFGIGSCGGCAGRYRMFANMISYDTGIWLTDPSGGEEGDFPFIIFHHYCPNVSGTGSIVCES